MPKLAANFSMMFGEVDMLDRFEIAARIGFRGAEIQNPYDQTAAEIARAFRKHNLEAVLFNMTPGVGAVPGREADFEAGVTRALEYAAAAGCGQIHCLAGRTDDPRAEATFVSNLQHASAEARPRGVRLLLEPLNTRDNPGYFLPGSAQARRLIDLVGKDNVFLQYDIYHMQIMEGDLAATLEANLDTSATSRSPGYRAGMNRTTLRRSTIGICSPCSTTADTTAGSPVSIALWARRSPD